MSEIMSEDDNTARTTSALLRRAAAMWPDQEGLVDGDVRMTFAQLDHAVEQSALAAMAAGVHAGDRVAVWAPNCWQWVVAAFGAQRAGAVLVTLNTRYKGDEAAYVLNQSRARLLFTVRGFLGTDYPALLEGFPTAVRRTVVFGDRSWDEYLAGAIPAQLPPVGEDDLSDIIFTSGTTGRPKGVMCSHGQAVRVIQDWCSIVGLRAGDRYLIVSPFFHTFGYKAGVISSINGGATIIPLDVVEIPKVLQLVDREKVTVLPASPTLFQSLFEHPGRDAFDLSTLRLSAVGAASVPAQLVRRMRAELCDDVFTGYGLTETSGIATMSRAEDSPEIISTTVGRAIPSVEIKVVDKASVEVPRGTPGEVLIRGYNVMRGYFEQPEMTADTIDADGWLHTGDIGTMDADGYLAITDRLKDMYIVGGFNAYPAEIEAALLRHPDIAMVAVIGTPDDRLGEVGMAFVVPRAGTQPSEESIVQWARNEMANFKVPRRVVFVDALPLNATGKVLKEVLRDQARAVGVQL